MDSVMSREPTLEMEQWTGNHVGNRASGSGKSFSIYIFFLPS